MFYRIVKWNFWTKLAAPKSVSRKKLENIKLINIINPIDLSICSESKISMVNYKIQQTLKKIIYNYLIDVILTNYIYKSNIS